MEVELTTEVKKNLACKLDTAYWDLSNRGLARAAQWTAEALTGLDVAYDQLAPPRASSIVMKARSLFQMNEFERCWKSIPPESSDPVELFLRLYARYHTGERMKEDAWGTTFFAEKKNTGEYEESYVNPLLEEIYSELKTHKSSDPFMLYLEGVIHRSKDQMSSAFDCLIKSVTVYPYNWSAWMELKTCFTKLSETETILDRLYLAFNNKPSEEKVILMLFSVCANEELDPNASVELLQKTMMPFFPKFSALTSQLARIYNSEGHYEQSAALFEKVLEEDPYRLEDLDSYSNLLYVTEQEQKLSLLARYTFETNKYRAESSCIMANYYSLKGMHEQSIACYKRALAVSRNCMSAWTLMGHEFIELGNPHAAIESYRTAVSIAGYDFRPWFGLGQAYELLGLHKFGLYYFQKALSLRPTDVRLWDSLANCYEALNRDTDALNAFQQAFDISEGDIYYCYRLGELNVKLGNEKSAMTYMTSCAEGDKTKSEDEYDEQSKEWRARAQIWLANRALEDKDSPLALHWVKMVSYGTREMLEEVRRVEASARSNQ